MLSVVLSMMLISKHLNNMVNPRQQRFIINIITMVPLFAVDSYIGLLDIHASETFVMVLDSLKECHEAYVIHSFLELMFSYLDVDKNNVPKQLKGRHLHHSFPFNHCFRDMHMDAALVGRLRSWTLQFVYLRPVVSVLSVGLQLAGRFDEFYIPIAVVLNVSVSLAVYALMTLYHAFQAELAPHRPLAQILCIKGVVFFAFWQSMLVELAEYMGWLHQDHWYSTDELAGAVQNLLVCVEMGLLFAFANNYAFTADPYAKRAAAIRKSHTE